MLPVAGSWKKADLHVHTSFSGWRSLGVLDAQDCYVPPDAAFAVARARGMDYVCFTDHDTIDGVIDFLSRCPEHERHVIVGEEVEAHFPGSTQWIHVGVLDVDEGLHRDMMRLRGNCFELVAELGRRGKFFALNHPFQSFRSIRAAREGLLQLLPLCPAVEACNGTSPRSHARILGAMLPGTVLVGGSDAHTRAGIATVYTGAPGESKAEFLSSLRAGRCAIGGRARGLGALIRDVYTIVGQYHARLYGRPWPLTPRRVKSLVAATALLPATLGGVPAALAAFQFARQEWIARCGPWAHTAAVRCATD